MWATDGDFTWDNERMAVVAPINEPCAWVGQDMARSDRWIRELRPEQIGEIEAALAAVEPSRHRVERDHLAADFPLPGLAGLVEDIRSELESGPGLIKVRGVPVERYDEGPTPQALLRARGERRYARASESPGRAHAFHT